MYIYMYVVANFFLNIVFEASSLSVYEGGGDICVILVSL